MYTTHFGLKAEPFSISPDPRCLYMSERHRDGLAHLLYGVHKPGGFIQLTGEVGTGKTTLCRCLLEQLPPEVDVVIILNPRVTVTEFLASVCDELRIPRTGEPWSVKLLVDSLYRYLLDAHARGRRTVLIVDEAQQLPPQVLEQIRLLTNLETSTQKLLQIILIGQPELTTLLNQRKLRQLNQRITARFHLEPLRGKETSAYIRHRLRVAGGDSVLFVPAAIRMVHGLSGGIPRLINILCDRAMLAAYACGARSVTPSMVRRAARDVRGTTRRPWPFWTLTWRAALAALATIALSGAILTASGRGGLPQEMPAPGPGLPEVSAVPSGVAHPPPGWLPGEPDVRSGDVAGDRTAAPSGHVRAVKRGALGEVLDAMREDRRDGRPREPRGSKGSGGVPVTDGG
jgi:general secretion pathway protein A